MIIKDGDELENMVNKELEELSNTLYSAEAKSRVFHKKMTDEDHRSSLLPSVTHNQSFGTSNCQPKLKKISIPSFDEYILNFKKFKRLFENLIHNNDELIKVQKFYYLKQGIVGSAKDLIHDYPRR